MAETIARVRRILLLLLITGVPLVFLPHITLDRFELPKLTVLGIGLSWCLALSAIEWVVSGRTPEANRLAFPTLAYLAPMVISWLVASADPGWAALGLHGRFQGVVAYAAGPVLGLLIADSFRGRMRQIVITIAATAGVVAGYLVWQSLGLDPFWVPGISSTAYPPSTIGHFNFAGGFVALGLAPAIWLWAGSEGRMRLLWTAVSIVDVVAVILSFSQGAWAAAVGAAVIAAAYSVSEKRSWAPRAAWIGVGLIATAMSGSVLLSGVIGVDAGATARTRAGLWSAGLGMAAESPIVGRGPNAYALEGSSHRSLESALTTESLASDDPHSVPVSFLANIGILGLLGFLAVAYWGVSRALTVRRENAAGSALVGVVVAYLLQAIVTIDVPMLRFAFWTALGGIAAGLPGREVRAVRVPALVRAGVGLVVVIALVVFSVAPVVSFLLPDVRAQTARELLGDRRPGEAATELEHALDGRADPEYRLLLIEALGQEALVGGAEGRSTIEELQAATGYLRPFPDARGHGTAGHYLHLWAFYDDSLETAALEHFTAALDLNPSEVNARIEAAESLIALGRTDDAIDLLEVVAPHVRGRLPEFWGAYSIALLQVGDRAGAVAAQEEAVRTGGQCRALMARELIRIEVESDPEPPTRSVVLALSFNCDQGQHYFFVRLLPERFRAPFEPAV